mgnify:CR=1 FL=1
MDRRRREGLTAREHEKLDEDLVFDALVYCAGNESAASRLLGMNYVTVRRVRRRGFSGALPSAEGYEYRTRPEGAPWVS